MYLVDMSVSGAHNLLHRNTRHSSIFSHFLYPYTACRVYKFDPEINFLFTYVYT